MMNRPRVGPLGPVGERDPEEIVVAHPRHPVIAVPQAPKRRRRRRPSGEPPPLPRPLQSTGMFWLLAATCLLALWITIIFWEGVGNNISGFDVKILDWFENLRSAWMTRVARGVNVLGSEWVVRPLRWSTLLVLLAYKRFRHAFVFIGTLLVVGWVATTVSWLIFRPRPIGIDILARWEGSSHPSLPAAALSVTLLGVIYCVIPPGRFRSMAKFSTTGILLLYWIARMYLGVDHPTDLAAGITLGVVVPLVAFRLITPNEVFPITYTRQKAAHLDIGGERGLAIRTAVEEQLGFVIRDMKPFGLAGSGGSTPIRLVVETDDGGHTELFAKLYAQNHLRADRWYKLGRTLLYGRLEDEASFQTVRRLIQYEDYMLRVMRDAGLKTPVPYGFVEITPEREYILVTSFLDDAEEILDAKVGESLMDDALQVVRTLWDAGLAHRDIKPSNLLVKEGRLYLIDVAFGQIRPSPWRQAVDLANMMIVLALRTDPDRVYERALKFFTPEEIAEAFAATQGLTIPSQSRDLMRKEKRKDIIDRFRELAPTRRRISIQRWSLRRAGLTLSVLFTAFVAVVLTLNNLAGAGLL
jgi:tRNA A-37 threonylcarbamoyl transferase component Bud32/membrane-associated phospholipid phosphatase